MKKVDLAGPMRGLLKRLTDQGTSWSILDLQVQDEGVVRDFDQPDDLQEEK